MLPYAAGLLQAYALHHAVTRQTLTFLPIVHGWPSIDETVARLRDAHLVAFSTYVWNIERSLAVARALKRQNPDILIVFGGPQVPDAAESFLRTHPSIDLACHGEGERTFQQIVDAAEARAWREIAGVSYREGVRVVHQPPAPRLKALDSLPSPYLTGVFDRMIAGDPARRWVMLWETNRGCPFACTFCDWGSAVASKVYQFDRARLVAELEWFAARQGEFIFCCDANFGLLPRDVDLAEAAAAVKARTGFPRTLSVQHTKNATERAYRVQKTLADAEMNAGVTLSLQSTDRHTLEMVRRDNISLDSFRELQRRYARDGITTYTDMILGLPGETYDSFANGIAETIASGQHTRIHFYNCALLPNAEMSQSGYRAQHGIRTVRQALIDVHGPIVADGDGSEFLEIVVGTASMPEEDWIRAKAFAWMTDLLHFDRLLCIPFALLHRECGTSYRALIETVMNAGADRFPTIAGVQRGFEGHARRIRAGGPEFIASPEWLGLCWPADQHALISLATSWRTDAFFREAAERLAPLAPALPVAEAVELNRQLFRLPFEIDDCEVHVDWNLWEVVNGAMSGAPVALVAGSRRYRVGRTTPVWLRWDDWLEHVVFCHNRKSAYLYPLEAA